MAAQVPFFSLIEELERAASLLAGNVSQTGSLGSTELVKPLIITFLTVWGAFHLGRAAVGLLFRAIDGLDLLFYELERLISFLAAPFSVRRVVWAGGYPEGNFGAAHESKFASWEASLSGTPSVDQEVMEALTLLDLSTDATASEVRAQFRSKIKAVHPDCVGHFFSPNSANEDATALIRAYRVALGYVDGVG